MVSKLGYQSMDEFVEATVPPSIRVSGTVNESTIPPLSESELWYRAKELAGRNKVFKSYIGMGYHNAVVPPVILRNVCSFRFIGTLPLNRASFRSWKTLLGIHPTPLTSQR
jgi:glycine dehydrogenase